MNLFRHIQRRKLIAAHAFGSTVARMPKYVFVIRNGSSEDHVVDLPDDLAAVEEGLQTASGLIRDLSPLQVGKQFRALEVRARGGKKVLVVDINAERVQ